MDVWYFVIKVKLNKHLVWNAINVKLNMKYVLVLIKIIN